MGEEAVYFAHLGARVKAIDISKEGVRILQRRADHHHLAHVIDAEVMRADKTTFASDTFDVIHGLGILHHIGLQIGLKEVRRILKPGGIGVFLEPLGDSPTVERVKAWLMNHLGFLGFEEVTDHEENLRLKDLEQQAADFSAFHTYPFHLLYRVKRFAPRAGRDLLRRIDCGVLALAPSLRHFAGAVVIKVRK